MPLDEAVRVRGNEQGKAADHKKVKRLKGHPGYPKISLIPWIKSTVTNNTKLKDFYPTMSPQGVVERETTPEDKWSDRNDSHHRIIALETIRIIGHW